MAIDFTTDVYMESRKAFFYFALDNSVYMYIFVRKSRTCVRASVGGCGCGWVWMWLGVDVVGCVGVIKLNRNFIHIVKRGSSTLIFVYGNLIYCSVNSGDYERENA